MNHGADQSIIRMFLRGITQGPIPANTRDLTYKNMAEIINQLSAELKLPAKKVWKKSDLQNAARGVWEPGTFEVNPSLKRLVEALSKRFGADAQQAFDSLFVSDESIAERLDLLESVLLALFHAHRQGVEPFKGLYVEGLLPTRQQILESFHPQVSEAHLDRVAKNRFFPEVRSGSDRQRIKRLLYRVGITGERGEACAKAIALSNRPKENRNKTPKNTACLKAFAQSLNQPDIALQRPNPSKLQNLLTEYGLKRSEYNKLVQQNFQAHSLANTPTNRLQINNMSRLLGVDSKPYLKALIDE
jgi:hypothetical protein